MTRIATIFSLSLILLPGCGGGGASMDPKIPPEVASLLKDAEGFELYSLEPSPARGSGKSFQGWTVLGKTVVKDSATRSKLVAALNDSVKNHDGVILFGFLPRHGIRLIPKGPTVDLVISFECRQVRVLSGARNS